MSQVDTLEGRTYQHTVPTYVPDNVERTLLEADKIISTLQYNDFISHPAEGTLEVSPSP